MRANDVIGRLGGDEFMLLLPKTGRKEAEAICARIRSALRDTPLVMDDMARVALSISCGVTAAQPRQSYMDLARQADRALYSAKYAGRDAVRFVA